MRTRRGTSALARIECGPVAPQLGALFGGAKLVPPRVLARTTCPCGGPLYRYHCNLLDELEAAQGLVERRWALPFLSAIPLD